MTGAVSKTDAGVNPRAQLTLILLWAIFDLLACAGFAVLLAIGLLTRRGKNNPVLLSLFAVFLLATASGPLLTWTGYAMSMDVPAGLCLVSGAFGSSWSAAQVSSAFALVLKVWAHALMLDHPYSKLLNWCSSSYFLVAIPWVVSLPFFFTAIGIGYANPDMVTRASPLYCTFHLETMNTAMLVFVGIFAISAVSLAMWTGTLVLRTRWRVRALRTSSAGSESTTYNSLTIRTLVFILLLTVALATSLSAALNNFSAPIPDIVTAVVNLIAVFVFGSDPHILSVLSCSSCSGTRTPRPTPNPTVSVSFTFRHSHSQTQTGMSGMGARTDLELQMDRETQSNTHSNTEASSHELAVLNPKWKDVYTLSPIAKMTDFNEEDDHQNDRHHTRTKSMHDV